LRVGEIIVVRSGAYTGDSAIVPERFDNALTGYDMVVRAKTVNARFLAWQFLASHIADYQFSLVKSRAAQPHLNAEDLGETLIVMPSALMQSRVAGFLDREVARMDVLIAKQTEFLTRLDEHCRAFITDAVTHGLDPHAAKAISNLAWIGEIPAHWRFMALRQATLSMCDGPFGSSLKSAHYKDMGTRVIRLQNIGSGKFRDGDAAYVDADYFTSLGGHDARPGDLLVAGLGDENHPVGRACVLPEHVGVAMVKADCFRVRLNPARLLARFAALFLSCDAARAGFAMLSRGATRERINLSGAASIVIPVPPLEEQHAIVAFVDRKIGKVEGLQDRCKSAIALLVERRTALITAAVTGQIDVAQPTLAEVAA
jgi:type I restriction enzyme S subunit